MQTTEKRRIVLMLVLAVIVAALWHSWKQVHPDVTNTVNNTTVTSSTTQDTTNIPMGPGPVNIAASSMNGSNLPLINIKTDVLDIKVNPIGGNIVYASLLKYPISTGSKQPVVLMNNKQGTEYYANSALVSIKGDSTQKLTFKSAQSSYQLTEGQKNLVVKLNATTSNGVNVEKTYTFYPKQYNIDVAYNVINNSNSDWVGVLSSQLTRANNPPKKSGMFHISSFFGASYSTTDDSYNKVSFKKMAKSPVSAVSQGGWVAMQQHYFLGAWVPKANQQNHYFSHISDNNLYSIGVNGPKLTIGPEQSKQITSTLYIGPEIASNLKALAPHLDLTIDYGFLWFISVIIFWMMQKIYMFIGNWGWSIIGVTVLIKMMFFHLSATSYRSMAKMRVLQPKIKALQERYADDKQKLTQATMELYKTEKANPLSGCLPILVQIPVFIALYWVLVESVQLRQAPFIFWIHDLSIKDPLYVLPILNGLAMFVQQKLNPPPPDPTQAKLMMLMPVFLTVVFMNFPAGLVLYWLVNSVFSITQQWYIMSTMEKREAKRKAKAKAKKKK